MVKQSKAARTAPSRRTLGGLFVALLSAILCLSGALDGLDQFLQDRMYQRPGLIDPQIFVIGIDEKSIQELGPYQRWPRDLMAEGIRALNQDPSRRPAVIAIDVVYTEHSEREMDASLIHAVSDGGNVILASVAYFEEKTVETGDSYIRRREAVRLDKPFTELEEAAAATGLINAALDSDHVLRRAYLRLPVLGQEELTLPAAICEKFTGSAPDISLDRYGQFLIPYTGLPGEYYRIESQGLSFSDLLNPGFDPDPFAGGIVLIGLYAPGLADSYVTPLNTQQKMCGVEIMANIVQTLLENNTKLEVSRLVQAAEALILALIFTMLFQKIDLRVSLAVTAAFCLVVLFRGAMLFEYGAVMCVLYLPMAAVTVCLYNVITGYGIERLERLRIKNTFKKYLDPALVDSLIDSHNLADEIGARKTISVLFVDIRGFTPLSEMLKDYPEIVVSILNDYFEMVCEAIFKNGGNIDKFIGDAAMALFNGFTPLDDHVFKAVSAAIDIINGAERVFAKVNMQYGVALRFGVGVHCGEAVVGNIGSSFRKDFTAIGDTVNTAARLEGYAQASQVLISQEVFDMLRGRISAAALGEVTMKGKSGFQVYQLIGLL